MAPGAMSCSAGTWGRRGAYFEISNMTPGVMICSARVGLREKRGTFAEIPVMTPQLAWQEERRFF